MVRATNNMLRGFSWHDGISDSLIPPKSSESLSGLDLNVVRICLDNDLHPSSNYSISCLA